MENTWYPVIGVMLSLLAVVGFSAMETGMARAKNAGNTVVKCAVGFMISIPVFILLGQHVTAGHDSILQTFMSAAACTMITNIIAGAVSERMKLSAYILLCIITALFIYPLFWMLESRFLLPGGLHDFTGLSIISLVGGAGAFFSAKALGARTGKYSGGGVSRAMPGHNIPLSILGMLLLIVCVSVLAMTSVLRASVGIEEGYKIVQNILLSVSLSGLTALLISWARYKKPDITISLSGMLSGAIAGSSFCDEVSLPGVVILAIAVGFCIVFSIENLDQNLQIDDPSGNVSIFGIGGIAGLLGTGLFSRTRGLFSGVGLASLGIQAATAVLSILLMAITITLVFWILKKTIGLRLLPEQEIEGLDTEENGLLSAYHDFTYNIDTTDWNDSRDRNRKKDHFNRKALKSEDWKEDGKAGDIAEPAYEYQTGSAEQQAALLTKIEIITRKEKFEELKIALNDIGITGMTVFPVSGCGVQKGYKEVYRGIPVEVQLRPKIRVEVVVAKVPVADVVTTARAVLNTGHVGDGKIFIHTLEDVVRVRTGEKGYDAMQGGASE